MSAATIAKAVLAAWEARDLDKTASLLADNFVLTRPAPEPLSKAAFLTFQKVHKDAFADWSFNARDFQEQGQVVRITIQITATHTGDFDVSKLGLPIPPITATGKSRQWPQETLITIEDDKIVVLHAEIGPGGGVVGTLEWLGVKLQDRQPKTVAGKRRGLWQGAEAG